jgi:uncharacterized Ntn-hydrolase superfamily protein
MRAGFSAEEALQGLLAADADSDVRQVSMIDSAGSVASHTGRCCIPQAGSYVGESFCTQANMMAHDTVWGAMAAAYMTAQGSLAERLLAALDAAQAEGGDLRGKQTAALLVVGNEPSPIPLVDLRVDHNPEPVAELHRLLRLHQAYELEYQIVDLIAAGEQNAAYDLIARVGEAAPDEPYLQCLRALHLERDLGRRDEALKILQPVVADQPQWRTYLERELLASEAAGCAGLDPQFLSDLDMAMEEAANDPSPVEENR